MSKNLTPEQKENRTRFFAKDWSITLPSRPDVVCVRVAPSRFDEMIPLVTNANNSKLTDTKDKVWDEESIAANQKKLAVNYKEGPEKQGCIEAFVEVDGKVVGFAGIWMKNVNEENERGIIGLMLNEDARGKGLGKLTVSVLAQVCFDMGFGAILGTMLANGPMRGVMKSLGVEEKREVTELPGRGIVSELDYTIEREGWKNVEMVVEVRDMELV